MMEFLPPEVGKGLDVTKKGLDVTKELIKVLKSKDPAKIYSKMYSTAKSIALEETKVYTKKMFWKDFEGKYIEKKDERVISVAKQHEYYEKRLSYHLNKMYRLIPLLLEKKE